jgi:hypothetical protein
MITKKIKHDLKMVTALSSGSLKPRLGIDQSFPIIDYHYPFISPFKNEVYSLAFPPFSPIELNSAKDQPQPPTSHQISFKASREYALDMNINQKPDYNISKVKNNKDQGYNHTNHLKGQKK